MSMNKETIVEISDRINTLVENREKGNVKLFSEKIGFNNQTVTNYLKGREPKISFITAVCNIYEVNPNWLLTGKGNKNTRKKEYLSEIDEWLTEIKKIEPGRETWFEYQFEDAFPAFKEWKERKENSEGGLSEFPNSKVVQQKAMSVNKFPRNHRQ